MKIKPERIYVASRLTDSNPSKTLINGGISIRAGIKIMEKGHFPFIPPLDFLVYLIMSHKTLKKLGEHYYYRYSLAWLDVCDSIVIVNGLEDSKGVQKEYKYAKEKGLKIYKSVKEIPHVKKKSKWHIFW